jgi:predicted AAA+ superfamily ATPase
MDGLIVIDEIQLRPNLFPTLRVLGDRISHSRDENHKITHLGRFLILGSAEPILLRQTTESLPGRIGYRRLSTFLVTEIPNCDMQRYFFRGAFPDSYLAESDDDSLAWEKDYIFQFLHRDFQGWWKFNTDSLESLWKALVAVNGQETNLKKILSSLQITKTDAQACIKLLLGLYLIDSIPPYTKNSLKWMIKTPKIYVTDSGLVANGLNIKSYNEIKSQTNSKVYGAMWEQIVLNHLRAWYPRSNGENIFFYRDEDQNEIDFILDDGRKLIAIECKTSPSAHLSSGAYRAMEKLGIPEDFAFTVVPFQGADTSSTVTLPELRQKIDEILNAPIV